MATVVTLEAVTLAEETLEEEILEEVTLVATFEDNFYIVKELISHVVN